MTGASGDQPSAAATKRRSERAHAAVLRAAISLFEQVGYSHLTIDAIAAGAGVSKATIYRWWPNKAAVVMEAFLTTVEDRIAYGDSGSIRSDLVEQVHALGRVLGVGRLGSMIVALLGEAQHDPELARALREAWQEPRRAQGREVVRRAVDRGELRLDLDPELVLDSVYGPVYLRLVFGHRPMSRHEVAALVDQILEGLLAPSAR